MLFFNKENKVSPFTLENNTLDVPDYESYISLLEINRDYYNIMREFFAIDYLYQTESYSVYCEAMSDIFDTIIKWLKKFKDMIVKLFQAFIKFIESLFMETEAYFKKYKDKIDLKKSFKYNMYEYDLTLLKKVPDTSIVQELANEFNSMKNKLKDVTPADLATKTENFLEEDNLEELRGKISTLGERLTSDEFREELKMAFRKGEKDTKEVDIDTAKAKAIMNSYGNFKTLLKEAKSERDKTLATITKLEGFFDEGAKKYRPTGEGSDYYQTHTVSVDTEKGTAKREKGEKYGVEFEKRLDLFYRLCYYKAKTYNEILYICFQERINIIKEIMKVYKAVGKKAILLSGKDFADDTTTKDGE